MSTLRTIAVDDRERAVARALASRHPALQCAEGRLDLGDFHVLESDGRVCLALERKTRADLRASLIDGRFHSQRSRLVAEYGHERVAYIVEGGTQWSDAECGAEVSLVMRDRIPIFWTGSCGDTADLIARLARSTIEARCEPPSSENLVRIATASVSDPERSLASMIRCIPGVSAGRAASIAAEFGSMLEMARVFSIDREAGVLAISEMRDRRGGKRFGSTIATRIAACMGSPASV